MVCRRAFLRLIAVACIIFWGMTKEEIIPMLEQYIKRLEFGREIIDPRQAELGLSLEDAKDCLERVRAGDDDIVEQITEILDQV
jgi:hypothetical protein